MVIVEEDFDGSNIHHANVNTEVEKFMDLLDQIDDSEFVQELKDCIFEMNTQAFLFGLTFENTSEGQTIQ